MRISDWSSDVCSSDLSNKTMATNHHVAVGTVLKALNQLSVEGLIRTSPRGTFVADAPMTGVAAKERLLRSRQIGRASCGERVRQYVAISVVSVSLKKKHQTIRRTKDITKHSDY